MEEGDDNIRENVMSKTLQEVQKLASTTEEGPDPCVICLDTISEKAIAYPCKHDSFDFLCLISWLQEKDSCPLCKAVVKNVNYDLQSQSGPKRYTLSKISKDVRPAPQHVRGRGRIGRFGQRPRPRQDRRGANATGSIDDVLARRRRVYAEKSYSLHVGTNRISQYQNLSPQSLAQNERLLNRAKMWIRRELQVFDFLNPDAAGNSSTQRRANNAEFLLEYIIAILKTVDLKGSKGQAEDLISEFLGREHTRLFLHELQAWLRSPYEKLEDWDRAVQYPTSNTRPS